MLGNGYSGIVTNLLKVVFLLILPGDNNLFLSSMIFFIASALVLLMCAFSYTILTKNPFFKYH